MGSVIADLRYAARELRRRPGFALTAVLSLALGIGATSAVFSVVYGVLINPFPYVGADRMMQISLEGQRRPLPLPGPDAARRWSSCDRRGRSRASSPKTDGTSRPPTAISPRTSSRRTSRPNAPNHWGVPALMGRWLIPADAPPGQDPARVVVLGYQFWQRYYSGDPAVVGRTHPTRAQELSDRRRDAAALSLARSGHLPAAQGQVRPQHLLRRQPQDPARRLDRGSERRAAADPGGVRAGRRRRAIRTRFA